MTHGDSCASDQGRDTLRMKFPIRLHALQPTSSRDQSWEPQPLRDKQYNCRSRLRSDGANRVVQ